MNQDILWTPSPERMQTSLMSRYMAWLSAQGHGSFPNYDALYRWSVERPEIFWKSVAEFSPITFDRSETRVLTETRMPGTKWFEGATLNFAQNLLAAYALRPEKTAIVEISEDGGRTEISGAELAAKVAALAHALRVDFNVKPGDRVVGYVSNSMEAVVAMLATTSAGGIWSSCSPDFGASGAIERFSQIEPKVMFAIDGYSYGGQTYPIADRVRDIVKNIPSIERTVTISKLVQPFEGLNAVAWEEVTVGSHPLRFESLPFDHPVYILYSSGTTGAPKCIVHGAGGTLLQHYKELGLHTDLSADDRLMYFTTTGWMMWNWMVSSLMLGTTLVLYEGSPGYPKMHRLWKIVEDEEVTVFGTSAKFIATCQNRKLFESEPPTLPRLKTILSTGSPLLAEHFDWVYKTIKSDVWLASISGGTDIVSCFFLGNPLLPVYRGELQCRGLGMAVEVFSDQGHAVIDQTGELVCTKPAPSMPVFFWNDPQGEKYRKAYFERFPGVWCHGDFVMINQRGGAVIYGRSDATLNPGGIRIGTAEIYRQVETIDEVEDSLVVGQPHEGDVRVVLFVVLKEGHVLDEGLKQRIKTRVKEGTTPRHVPHHIFAVEEIPYTMSGKKVELAVTRLLSGQPVTHVEALKNPGCLEDFKKIKERHLNH